MKKFYSFVAVVISAASGYAQSVSPVHLTPHTGFSAPVGIDHHQPTNQVVISVNYPSGQPYNFELVDIYGNHQQFSNIRGLTEEVKIATARDDGGGRSLGGFTPGELFTGTGVPGHIARISADGATVQNPWVVLPGETGLLRGSLHVDRTGVFGGDLIVVTTEPAGNVWRVSSGGMMTKLASLGIHLEGVTTVPDNPAKYGPWAGKILAGAEQQGRVYAIDVRGNTTFYELGINPEDIDLIPPDENFFGVDYGSQTIWTAPPSEFADKIGDVLIAQEDLGLLFHVRWTGTKFQVTRVAQVTQWEHVTFSTSPVTPIFCNVKILSPADGSMVCDDDITVIATHKILGGKPPLTITCDVNGKPVTYINDSTFTATVSCAPGRPNWAVATCRVVDSQGSSFICRDSVQVECAPGKPSCSVTIMAPQEDDFLCVSEVVVTATVDISCGALPFNAVCDINGIPATLSGNTFSATVPLSPGANTIVASCEVTDACGRSSFCRATKTVFVKLDETPPDCVFKPAYKSVTGTFFDKESGIASVEPLFLYNAELTVDPFQPGDTQVNFRLDDLGLDSYIGFNIKITDLCGNSHVCDPVLFQLQAEDNAQPFVVNFNAPDRYLTLTNHGLTKIRADLNGQVFTLVAASTLAIKDLNAYAIPLEGSVTIDLQPHLRTGENKIRFEFAGAAGTNAEVMLIDEAHQIDYALELQPLPEEYQLSQNYPNPFWSGATSRHAGNPTTIRFSLPARAVDGAPVQLRIYNTLGGLVRTLLDEKMLPGQFAVQWDGKDADGAAVASGVYIYQLVTGDFRQQRRMIVLR